MTPKVFGVGFHKTGTTTLQVALSRLGYRVCSAQLHLAEDIRRGDLDAAWQLTERFDAFRDNPWPILYEHLDRRYPGSKFILTSRSPEKWIESVVRHFGTTDTEMRRIIYGAAHPRGHEAVYLNRYLAHNAAIRAYFAKRPTQFCELSWEQGDGWLQLCDFLAKPMLEVRFPHENRRAVENAALPPEDGRRLNRR